MRRLVFEEPFSGAAVASRRLAAFALAVAAIGVFASRAGLDPPAAFAVLGGSIGFALAAVVCALAGLVVVWRTGRRGAGRAGTGLVLAALLLAYPAYMLARAAQGPRLTDLSTDLADPPAFSFSRAAYAARGAPPPTPPASARAEQAKAYPKILPMLLDLDADDAFAALRRAVKSAGWKVVEAVPPGGRMGLGHIEAIAASPILGLPSYVTVRLRPVVEQSRVDVRSASRFGPIDFGVNARNIAAFETALEAAVDHK
ncbi:DUF1499 domain-containing protein [Methylocella sp.]|uniref:DUF1499 domain-containing protein n=1 Tax=Methylocella sp. TaxID=1978226 RepID=UPI003784E3A1